MQCRIFILFAQSRRVAYSGAIRPRLRAIRPPLEEGCVKVTRRWITGAVRIPSRKGGREVIHAKSQRSSTSDLWFGLSHRQVARMCGVARSSVSDYLARAERAGINWPLPDGMSEQELENKLFSSASVPPGKRALPDCAYIQQELRRHKKYNLTLICCGRSTNRSIQTGTSTHSSANITAAGAKNSTTASGRSMSGERSCSWTMARGSTWWIPRPEIPSRHSSSWPSLEPRTTHTQTRL